MSSTALWRRSGCAASVLALSIAALGGPVPAASAAVAPPKALAVSTVGASTPVLTWGRVKKATTYQVQVDNDPRFGSPEFDSRTENTSAVPTKALRPGTANWRVRAVAGKETSDWAEGRFTVNAVDIPAPTHPDNGATLPQPQSPPLLRWTTSRGAVGYVVEVDGDADFVGAKQYKTKSTALVVPDTLGEGDWFWRVTADKGDGITSAPSAASSFVVQGLALPNLTFPNSSFDEPIEDVVLDWDPVPGAQGYDLQVALDPDFNNFALDITGIRGTRYSPPVTLNNDEFWWRVRAVDTAGLPTPWQSSRFNFKRVYPDIPTAQWPLGNTGSPGLQGIDTTYFQWTPVQHASRYQLEVSASPTFASLHSSCVTAGTTFVPRFGGGSTDCSVPANGNVYWWRVRPLDQPYESGGLPGSFSAPQAFTRSPQPARSGSVPVGAEWLDVRTPGQKVSMTGNGAGDSSTGCVSTPSSGWPGGPYNRPSVCAGMSATPVFSWDRMPNMDYYVVWFAQDENFTTTELQPIETGNTMLAIDDRERRQKIQLPDSGANRPYYWYVQGCVTGVDCSPPPYSDGVGINGAASFEKASPKVEQLSSSPGDGNDITFSWRDYADTNIDTWSHNERGIQSAKQYRVIVDNEPGFSEPYLDDATIDQATYTATNRLYPEGTLFWKVLVIDTHGNQVGESPVQTLTKSSPPVGLRSPVGGAGVAGSTPLEWNAQAFATTYTVEVYRNGDTGFSPANRVLSATTRNASFAPPEAFPADPAPYVWRVRRTDPSKNPGPWSATGSFYSLGSAPELLAPAAGKMHRGDDLLFVWSDVPGATSYVVSGSSSAGKRFSESTVASAYAPSRVTDGAWTWTVTALDSDGKPLGVSASGSFRVDGAAPKVSLKASKLSNKKKAKIVATFSEKVKGVSKKTMLLYKKGAKKPIKAKVSVKGTKATLKPKSRLKRGVSYYVVFKNTKIKDLGGNTLPKQKKWTTKAK